MKIIKIALFVSLVASFAFSLTSYELARNVVANSAQDAKLRLLFGDKDYVDEAGNAGRAADSFVYTAADTNPATVTPQMIHSVTLIEPPPGLRYAFFCEKMFDIWPDW